MNIDPEPPQPPTPCTSDAKPPVVAFVFPFRDNPHQRRFQQLAQWPVDAVRTAFRCKGVDTRFYVAEHPEEYPADEDAIKPSVMKRGARSGWVWGGEADEKKFNRGLALNVGTNTAFHEGAHIVVGHDIDLWPGLEGVSKYVELLAEAARLECEDEEPEAWALHLGRLWRDCPYADNPHFCGGALAMNASAWHASRGYPNLMYGWGGEDDVWGRRAQVAGIPILRPAPEGLLLHVEEGPHASEVEAWANTRKHEDLRLPDERLGTAQDVGVLEGVIRVQKWYERIMS